MTQFDELRRTEFSRLDEGGHVYLDYTGSGLYGASQIAAHLDLLSHDVLGNPHSENPTSLHATELVEETRSRVLRFFDADPEKYEVIFTLNASGALKIVGESYPFGEGSRYVLIADNHNSVNGIREFARAKGAVVVYVPLDDELRVSGLEKYLTGNDRSLPNLFSFPAQSNFSGVKHPLEWVKLAQEAGYDVLLDAAAYAPTNPVSLSEVGPDFVALSFYKMFGYPTGVGALIARRDKLARLVRPWFAGGTVRFVSAQNEVHRLHLTGEAFEDGTINFLNIPAVITGLDFLETVGVEAIRGHVTRLTERVINGMHDLKHSNGNPVIDFYGPGNMTMRGGTVTFNVLTPSGENEVDSKLIEQMANEEKISLRTGCFCNPGAAESAFHYSALEAYQCFEDVTAEDFTLQQFSVCMNEMPVGAVRVSLGIASNDADVDRLLAFMKRFVDFEPGPDYQWRVPDYVDGGA